MPATTPPLTTLEGRFIRLEPLTPEVYPELYSVLGVPEVFAGGYGGGPAGLPHSEAEFVEFASRYYDASTRRVFAVRLVDGTLVGTSSLGDFDEVREHAHIGWTAYSPSVWGGPVNPEAKLLMLGHAFDHGFGRVKLQADSLNGRSRAAILKLGATFEGIVRRDMLRPDGIWRDTAVYSILIDEWPAVREMLERRIDV